MAYIAPTAAEFAARFPRFVAVPSNIIDAALVEASRRVDTSWTEGDYALGIMLYAAHVLTLDGQGAGAEAKAAASGALGYKTIRSGALSLDRFDRGNADAGSVSTLKLTSYGQRYLELLSLNKQGVAVANVYS